MKLNRKILCALLALAVLVMPFAIGEEAEDFVDLRLGDSEYLITIPASFQAGTMSEADLEDDQVGYYYSGETPLDFDVYQFDKEPAEITLADYIRDEAADYEGVTNLETDVELNEIPLGWYHAVEEYEGESYETVTMVLESGDQFVEIVFWLDGENAISEMETIVETLRRDPAVEEAAEESEEPEAAEEIDEEAEDVAEAEETEDVEEEVEEAEAVEDVEDAEAVEEPEEDVEDVEEDVEDDAEEDGVYLEAAMSDMFSSDDAAEEEAEEADDVDEELKEILADIVRDIVEADGGESTPEEYVEAAMEQIDDELKAEIAGAVSGETDLQLGTSPYSITIPAGYEVGELSEEDIADDMVAYYLGSDDLVDFDVYHFTKEDLNPDLTRFAMEEAASYENTTEVVGNDMINDIPVAWYRAIEDYEGVQYTTETYILDAGDSYVEIVFWMEDDEDVERAIEIMDTLREE